MEVETRNKSVEIAEEAMAVDSSDSESYSSDEDVDKNKSNTSGSNVKNKLLLFKFESSKKTNKPLIKTVDKSIENEEDDDDVIDISNEVLVSDINKKKRKRKISSESTKKKRKSLEKNKEVEGKEELKENMKSDENVLKDDKEKVKPAEKCTDKKDNSEDKNIKKKEKVDSEKDIETQKTLKVNAKKSPNPRKSKSNETSSGTPGVAAKPLLTMDKFIIRKKTLEEVEKEKIAKQNEKKIDIDEVMIIDDEDISKETKSSQESDVEEMKKDEVTEEETLQEALDKCDTVKNKELNNKGNLCTKTSINGKAIQDIEQVKVVLDKLPSYETEKSIEQQSTEVVDEVLKSDIKTKKTEDTSTIPNNKNEESLPIKATENSIKTTTDTDGIISDSSSEVDKEKKESTAEREEEKASNSIIKKDKSLPGKISENSTEKLANSPEKNDNAKQSTDVSPESNNEKNQADQSTPLSKRRQSVNNKTPKPVTQRTLEPKKLTPKQVEKQEELARKKEELARKKEEKEQEKERLRLEREQKKLEEEEKKRKEREEKEEARRAEKELKEKQRKEQEELRRKEKESKEQIRLMQIEVKNKEKAAREEERKTREEERRKREEAEKEKKEKAAAAFASFFKKGGSGEEEEAAAVSDTVPAEKRLNFMPFQIKGDMRMAPTARTVFTPERSARLDSVLTASGEAPQRDALYLGELKREDYTCGKGEKTWPAETEEEPDVIIVESEFSDGFLASQEDQDSRGGFYNYPPAPARRVRRRAKLLQFHDNRRPPYFGTWSKKTAKISGRSPFRQDEAMFEYEVDSDEEWEEEGEGESLRGSEDEKEEEEEEGGDQYEVDNQMFVPHGYLSDEEEREDEDANLDPEAHKMKLKLMELEFEEQMKQKTERLKPRLIGCVYLSNSGHYSTVTVGPHIRDLLLTRRAVYLESSIPITTTTAEETPVPPLTSSPSSGAPTEGAGGANEKLTTKDCMPDSEMSDLIKLVHGSYVSRKNLSKEFSAFVAANGKDLSLALIQKTIREIAEWMLCPLPECTPNTYPRKCWFVKPEIREKFGLADFLACQNSWKFIVEPPTSEKTGTPTARKESGTPTAGGGRNEKDSNNTPTSSRKRKTPKSVQKDGDNTPTSKRSKGDASNTQADSPLVSSAGRNEEEEVCSAMGGEPAASPHASLITKFTKVLSEEERIEQLTKTKVKTTPKPTKMMPKSKLELFKSQSGTKNSNSATNSPSTAHAKKRATLITLAKTTDTPQDSNAKAGQKPEVIDLDTASNQDDKVAESRQDRGEKSVESSASSSGSAATSKTPKKISPSVAKKSKTPKKISPSVAKKSKTPKKISPSGADKSKTPRSGRKVAKKSTPGAPQSSPPSVGAATKTAAVTPALAKPSNSGGRSATTVSIMNFITKERPKRKSDDGTEEVKREEQGGRKKMKLETVGGKEGEKVTKEVECVQIESSNEGW